MIQIVYSTQHWIVPHIVMGILVVLLAAIILTEGMARVKNGKILYRQLLLCEAVWYSGIIHWLHRMSECHWFYCNQYRFRVPVQCALCRSCTKVSVS